MKRILTAALAVSLLSGAGVVSQPGNQNRPNQSDNRNERDRNEQIGNRSEQDRNDQNRNDRSDNRNERDRSDQSRSDQSRSDQGRNDQGGNRYRQDDPSVRFGTPRYSRGDRLPNQYRQNQYVVSDWRQHGLRQPPRGYHWVRNDYNDFFLAAIATGIIAEIAYRNDRDQIWRQRYSNSYTYNDDIYYRECRNSPDPAGVIAGALIGGLLGNVVGQGGGRTGATIAGVIVGGAVGAALTSNLDCEDRSYAYKTYYDGFNAGRPNATYRWQNPRNDHRGEFRVGNYYNDPVGFRCANYSQVIYVQGRQQEARGRACRQPDGSWAIVG